MSFAKRFNIATAMEEIKEDTTGDFDNVLEEQADEITEIQESIVFSTDEIGKGLEAISDLIKLSNKVQKNEKLGVSTEGYSDIAQIAFESILNRIGIEDGEVFDKDDPTGKDAKDITDLVNKENTENKKSGKIRRFIDKMVEIIKKIIKKVTDFFKNIFNIVVNFVKKTVKKLEYIKDNIDAFEYKLRGATNFEIENPKFFKDKKLVTAMDVFEYGKYSYVKNARKNLETIINVVEIVSHGLKKSAFSIAKDKSELDTRTDKLFRATFGADEKSGIHVSPEGYIQLIKNEDSFNKLVFTKIDPDIIVEKQIFSNVARLPEFIDLTISGLLGALKDYEDMVTKLDDKLNVEIPQKLKDIQVRIKLADPHNEEKIVQEARNIKLSLDYLTSIKVLADNYLLDIAKMVKYYSDVFTRETV